MSSEAEALAQLEDRIRRAVELVTTLRAERDAAVGQRDAAVSQRDSATSEVEKLRAQAVALEQERGQVRSRIEKLLGQMDQL
jgi:FtsZ-binding cell division protein ZapB